MAEKPGRPAEAKNKPKESAHHLEELKKKGLTREDILKHFDDVEAVAAVPQKLEIEKPAPPAAPESFTCGACKRALPGKVDCCPHCQQYLTWG